MKITCLFCDKPIPPEEYRGPTPLFHRGCMDLAKADARRVYTERLEKGDRS
jgi:hypothetical protein